MTTQQKIKKLESMITAKKNQLKNEQLKMDQSPKDSIEYFEALEDFKEAYTDLLDYSEQLEEIKGGK